ncbi:MAG: hypothetical protein WBD75_00090 [Phycisphaerae bacterium]
MQAVRMLFTLVSCLVVPLGMAPMSAGGSPPISEEAAIAAYAKAAKALRIAEDGEKPTISKAEARTSERTARVVGSVRKVRSPVLSVDVDACSEKIVCVQNERAWERSYTRAETARQEGTGIGPTQTPKQILDAAENYCRALGQNLTPDLGLWIMEFDDKRGCWILGWVRRVNGYLFEEEYISIHIEDQTGGLVLYHNRVTQITCNTDVRVPKDRALAIAQGYMSKILPSLVRGQPFEFDLAEEPELWIVYVNNFAKRAEVWAEFWAKAKAEGMTSPEQLPPPPSEKVLAWARREAEELQKELLPPRARLVYAIRFEFSYVGKEKVHRIRGPVSIWVDAANGEIVGGLM